MVKKKSQINKATKKAKVDTVPPLDSDVKDLFISEAKNTTFTEEDVEKMNEDKKIETPEEPVIEKENITEDDNVGFCVTGEENTPETEEGKEDVMYVSGFDIADYTVSGDETITSYWSSTKTIDDSYTLAEEGGLNTPDIENEVSEKDEEEVVVTVNDEPVVKEKPKRVKSKNRTTSQEAYGNYWMGLVYED